MSLTSYQAAPPRNIKRRHKLNESAKKSNIYLTLRQKQAKYKANMNQILSPERLRLIVSVAAVIAVATIIAVLVFQIIEFQYYRQSPTVWPTAFQSK